jgi:hypothetical protein
MVDGPPAGRQCSGQPGTQGGLADPWHRSEHCDEHRHAKPASRSRQRCMVILCLLRAGDISTQV